MMVPVALAIGAMGSITSKSYLPIIGALVVCFILHELMLYDIHRHLLNLEGENDG